MASEVGICNIALRRINADPINSLSQGTKTAEACNALYPTLRDELLRKHTWNFAIARAKLARLAALPVFEWDHAYQLPADQLRVVDVAADEAGSHRVRYKIEGMALLSSAEDIYLRYVRRETDPNVMTPDFRRALSLWLAADLAIGVANSRTLRDQMLGEYQAAVLAAKSADALEDDLEDEPESAWVSARH